MKRIITFFFVLFLCNFAYSANDSAMRFPTGTRLPVYNKTDSDARYLKLDQTTPQTIINGVTLTDWELADMTDSLGLINKEYVDIAVEGIEFDFFLNDTASDIATYFEMRAEATGEAESTFSEAIVADDTLIDVWITPSGSPAITTLSAGVYEFHFHADTNVGAQVSTARIYYEFYKRAAGGAETLLTTSEETEVLTNAKTSYAIHATLDTDETILTTDRLLIKVYGNVEDSRPQDPTANIYAEGTNATRFAISTTSTASDNRYFVKNGLSGGQIAHGGNETGDDLTLRGTSHADNNGDVIINDLGGGLIVDTTTLVVNATGYEDLVGIGTATPSFKLDVQEATVDTGVMAVAVNFDGTNPTNIGGFVLTNVGGTNTYTGMLFTDTIGGVATGAFGMQLTDVTNHYGDLVFLTRDVSGFAERMRVKKDGKVGINTDAPWETLTVSGDTVNSDASPKRVLRDSTDNTAIIDHLDTADTTYGIYQKILGTDDGTGAAYGTFRKPVYCIEADGDTRFPLADVYMDNDLYVDTDTLYVDSANDRVGIGTATPDYKVHIRGIDDELILHSTSNQGKPKIGMTTNYGFGVEGFKFYYNGNTGDTHYDSYYSLGGHLFRTKVRDGITTVNAMYIDENGNVGIGTATPWQALTVNGDGVFSDTNPNITWRMSGTDLAHNLHGNIDGANDPWGVAQFWANGSDDGTNGFAVGAAPFNEPAWCVEADNDVRFPSADVLVDNNIALSGWLSGDGDDEGITIDGSGNVGIGTATPRASLEIIGDVKIGNPADSAYDTGYQLRVRGDGSTDQKLFSALNNDGTGGAIITTDVSGHGKFEIMSTGGAVRFRLATSGDCFINPVGADDNFGIGDTEPNQRLGLLGTNAQISIEESDTEFVRIGVEATGGDMCIGWDDSDDMHLGVFTSPTDTTVDTKVTIASGGNVTLAADLYVDGGDIGLTADTNLIQLAADDVLVNGGLGTTNQAISLGIGDATFAVTSNVITLTGEPLGNSVLTITGGANGQLLTIIFTDGLVTLTDDNGHGADTLDLTGNIVGADDTVVQLVYDSISWYQVSAPSVN